MPFSWDREYDFEGSSEPIVYIVPPLPGPESADNEDDFLAAIIAHDVAVAGRNFMNPSEDFDPGDEDDEEPIEEIDPLYEPDDDDEEDDYFPMIDGGTDSDDGFDEFDDDDFDDESLVDPDDEEDDGYGDDA